MSVWGNQAARSYTLFRGTTRGITDWNKWREPGRRTRGQFCKVSFLSVKIAWFIIINSHICNLTLNSTTCGSSSRNSVLKKMNNGALKRDNLSVVPILLKHSKSLLTPFREVLVHKPTVAQRAKKFSVFFETHRIHCKSASSFQSNPHNSFI
jgi:hypothetical protein